MAMYPINKLSQFDKKVTLITPAGSVASGGMILIKPLAKPEKQTFSHIQEKIKTINPESYYTNDPSTPPSPSGPSPSGPSPSGPSQSDPSQYGPHPGPSPHGNGMSKSMKLFLVIMLISILFLVALLVYILVNKH